MHDLLFANQAMAAQRLSDYASLLALDQREFKECLRVSKHKNLIERDLKDGQSAGVGGTPTFFLGTIQDGANTVHILKVLHGALPFERFQETINAVVRSAVQSKLS
jgi:protein-disulfide isomerase